MKSFIHAGLLAMFLAFAPAACHAAEDISQAVMPASEHPDLTDVEIGLLIADLDNSPGAVSDFVAQMLRDSGVVAAVNFTYTWGDPEAFLLIDANVHRYPTAAAASDSVVGNLGAGERVDGIGDAALVIGSQSIIFAAGKNRVVLTTFSEEVNLTSVAETYAAWLAGDE